MAEDENRNQDAADAAEDPILEARMIRIMQYCDGMLAPREAAAVADEIARDPEAARLAAELSAGADAARMAWADLESGPVPFDLARRVRELAKAPAVALPTPGLRVAHLRMAAALLVGALLGASSLALVQQHSGQGLRLAGTETAADQAWQPALMKALARDPGTEAVPFDGAAGSATVRVARWFDTATGQRCAEFVRSRGTEPALGGIACRKADGAWDLIEQDQ